MGHRRSLAWSSRHMRAIFRLYLPHVRYRCANIDRQVESNGLPSRWKSKFMVGPTVPTYSPRRSWNSRMSVSIRGNVSQWVWATCTILLHTILLTCMYACNDRTRIFTTELSKNDFFSLLITYAIRKPRRHRLREQRIMYTQSLRMSYGKLDRRIV